MKTTYKNENGSIEISIRQLGRYKSSWALFINGAYKYSKVLPNNNTAIVQNFGFLAADFN